MAGELEEAEVEVLSMRVSAIDRWCTQTGGQGRGTHSSPWADLASVDGLIFLVDVEREERIGKLSVESVLDLLLTRHGSGTAEVCASAPAG